MTGTARPERRRRSFTLGADEVRDEASTDTPSPGQDNKPSPGTPLERVQETTRTSDASSASKSAYHKSATGINWSKDPNLKVQRCHSFSELETAPAIKRVPIKLFVSQKDPCVCRLHVQCHDEVGVLFLLVELLARHGIGVDTADIAVVGDLVDNRFLLRAPRPTDFADASEWCHELEKSIWHSSTSMSSTDTTSTSPSVQNSSTNVTAVKTKLEAAQQRLGVNPHLLCVSLFQEMGPSTTDSVPELGKRRVKRYRLELKGINQAGLLAYICMVFAQCGFSVRRAHISTKDGQVTDVFELNAAYSDSVRRLSRYLNMPDTQEESTYLPQLKQLWAGETPRQTSTTGADGAGAEVTLSPNPHAPSEQQPGSLQRATSGGLWLPNGDFYSGSLGGEDGQQRHGYGVYCYVDNQASFLRYSGQWRNNTKHGFGTLLLRDGSAYVGQWKDNERHGVGVMFGYGSKGAAGQASMPTNRYEGEWQNDQKHGIGIEETEDHLYCGQFERGIPSGNGLRSDLRRPGLAGCTALVEGEWKPLVSLLADPEGNRRGAAHPFQALAGAHDRLDEFASQPAGATFHFGTRKAAAARPGLSTLQFESSQQSMQHSMTQTATDLERQAKGEVVASVAAASSSGFAGGAPISVGALASKVISVAARVISPGPNSINGAMMEPDTPAVTSLDLPISEEPKHPRSPPKKSSSSLGGDKAAIALLDKKAPLSPSLQVQAMLSPRNAAVPNRATPHVNVSVISPIERRAVTPQNVHGGMQAVIACPMLWSEQELATVVGCLGVVPSASENLRDTRMGGAGQLVAMSNAQMSQDLGLAAPLERLVVRRSLTHLLEADRWANSCRGTSLWDVLDDPSLRKYVIPLDHLTLQSSISQGGFGVVYQGLLLNDKRRGHFDRNGQAVAVKEMLGDHKARLYELLKEAHVMASLNHPNICRFIGVCTDGRPRGRRYIVSELLHCSLFDLIHRPSRVPAWKGTFNVRLTLKLLVGICSGLVYIHERSLVHADLKSSNILIELRSKEEQPTGSLISRLCSIAGERTPIPRICDFGHSAVRISSLPHDRLCTPHWAAPEVLRGEGLGPAADIFSVGVLFWEMLAKKVPHHDLGFGQVLASVGWAGATPDMSLLPHGLPQEITDLLSECLRFLPAERPTAAIVKQKTQAVPKIRRKMAVEALMGFIGCTC